MYNKGEISVKGGDSIQWCWYVYMYIICIYIMFIKEIYEGMYIQLFNKDQF